MKTNEKQNTRFKTFIVFESLKENQQGGVKISHHHPDSLKNELLALRAWFESNLGSSKQNNIYS